MRLPSRASVPASPVPRDFLDQAETLTSAFSTLVEHFPDFRCLTILDRTGEEQRLTLGELWHRAQEIRATLESGGLQQGGVVILILPTGPELVAAYFAVLLAGGVPGLVATPSNRVADHDLYAGRVGAILANALAQALYCSPEVGEIFRGDRAPLLAGAALLTPEMAKGHGSSGAALAQPQPEDTGADAMA